MIAPAPLPPRPRTPVRELRARRRPLARRRKDRKRLIPVIHFDSQFSSSMGTR
jgi:hypothetical protein